MSILILVMVKTAKSFSDTGKSEGAGKRRQNKEKTRRAILQAALALFAKRGFAHTPTTPPSSQTCSYFVSTSGSDSNPGTQASPFRTIQKAAKTVTGGKTVCIRGGTYNERVSLVSKGNSSGPYITFTNYNGEQVILDGTGIAISYGGGLFHIEYTDYVRVTGLTVQHSNGAGIYTLHANNIQIDHNLTNDTVKSGIGVWVSTNTVVDSNDIELACNAHSGYSASEENISIAMSSNVEVKNNLVHKASNIANGYAGGEGINIKDGSHDVNIHHNTVHLDERPDGQPSNRLAFGLDAWTHETYNVYFYDNIAYNSKNGIIVESEQGGTAHDIWVYNNLAYNNNDAAYFMPNYEGATAIKQNIYFINNTAYNNGYGININVGNVTNVVIRNNIFYQNRYGAVNVISSAAPNVVQDHNLTTDPKFVNAAGNDFHLQSGSSAINAGSSTSAPSVDYDGVARPQGGAYDIGAYEYR